MSSFRTDTAALFQKDVWLSDVLRQPVFRLAAQVGPEIEPCGVAAVVRELGGSGDAFFFAKLATSSVSACATLTNAGFYVVDTAITLAWKGGGTIDSADVEVGPMRPAQGDAVLDIAAKAFRWSRFHLDPRISTELANRIKREWMANYVSGARGSAVYTAEAGGRIAGFLAVIESSHGAKAAVIDLLAVAPEFQGRGVGVALVRKFIEDWKDRASELKVGTQAANIRSLRLYENCGFRTAESAFVLHGHYREGELRR